MAQACCPRSHAECTCLEAMREHGKLYDPAPASAQEQQCEGVFATAVVHMHTSQSAARSACPA